MLSLQTITGTTHKDIDLSGNLIRDIVWIDLLDPQADEVAFVERTIGLHVPTLEELVEIEVFSSRVHLDNGALYLSTPVLFRGGQEDLVTSPVGFVLTQNLLITTRYKPLTSFADVMKRMNAHANEGDNRSSAIFVALVNAIVDRMADALEHVGAELGRRRPSRSSGQRAMSTSLRRPARQDEILRETLRRVGRSGVVASKLRDSLLGHRPHRALCLGNVPEIGCRSIAVQL